MMMASIANNKKMVRSDNFVICCVLVDETCKSLKDLQELSSLLTEVVSSWRASGRTPRNGSCSWGLGSAAVTATAGALHASDDVGSEELTILGSELVTESLGGVGTHLV